MAKKTLTIELFTAKGKQPHRFRVKAANGEVIHASEGYSTRSNRKRAAKGWAEMQKLTIKWVDLTPYGKAKAKRK